MSESADSEIQFNMNANRPREPVDDEDVQPQMLPDQETEVNAIAVRDAEEPEEDDAEDLIANTQDDNALEVDTEVEQMARQPHTYKIPGRNHGYGDRDLNGGFNSPVRLNIRGRPRQRLGAQRLPRRYDDSEDSEQEEHIVPRNRQRQGQRNLMYPIPDDVIDNIDEYIPRRPRMSLPVIKPETYDGTSDWDSYFSHFTNCADLGRWTDEQKALTLASCLSGPARIFYLGLRDQERKIYRVLMRKLNERFGSKKQQTRYITKFETRRRGAGEAVASFGDDLRLTAQRAYPDLGVMAQESLALHQFYKTLSPEMKCRCIDKDCKTVEQAVEIVERYESILGVDEKKRTVVRAVSGAGNDAAPGANGKEDITMMKQIREILARLETMESKIDIGKAGKFQEARRRDGSERVYSGCYICKDQGHYAKDCPSRSVRPNYYQQKSGNAMPLV
jgi:hypothetical protein